MRREFSLKPTLCGWIVMVREQVPGLAPGTWEWGRWRRIGIGELPEVVARLRLPIRREPER